MIDRVQAQHLRKGDYLPAAKSTVVQVTLSGVRIPAGKVEVVLKSGPGVMGLRTALWNKTVLVRVEREE